MEHLFGIGFRNFRVFKSEQWIDFAPITILTGTNNSGKSSVFKAILLLQNSLKNNAFSETLNFKGGNHNLGDSQNSLNDRKKPLKFVVNFPLLGSNIHLKLSYTDKSNKKNRYYLALDLVEAICSDSNKLLFQFQTSSVEKDDPLNEGVQFYHDATVYKLKIVFNSIVFKELLATALDNSATTDIPPTGKKRRSSYNPSNPKRIGNSGANKSRAEEVLNQIRNHPQKEDFLILLNQPIDETILLTGLDLDATYHWNPEDESLLNYFLDFFPINLIYNPEASELHKEFGEIFKKLLWYAIVQASEELNKSLNCSHLSSVRANLTRLYASEGSAFNEIVTEFAEISKGYNERSFVDEWLTKFNLDGFDTIEVIPYYEYNANRVVLRKGKKGSATALIDVGYGTSQLVAILLKIANQASKHVIPNEYIPPEEYEYQPHTMLIEEPEANLHPKLQSFLADLFLDATKRFNIQFILETHSEYLIRKLQYLVAKREVKHTNIALYYLRSPQEKEVVNGEKPQIQRIEIDIDGAMLGDFGDGFFDEAPYLITELWKAQRSQN